MLYEAERHETLRAERWGENRARTTIQTIAADAAARFDPQALWPVHPLDHTDMTNVSSDQNPGHDAGRALDV